MNVLIYFSRPLNPYSGGTERVAFTISNYLKAQGHNVLQLACIRHDGEVFEEGYFLPEEIERASESNIIFVNDFIKHHEIQVVINESANSDAVFLFSHEHISRNVKIITHLHFDIYGDIETFYASHNLPLLNVRLGLAAKNLLKWCKMPYNRYRAIKWKKARFDYMHRNSDYVVLLTEQHVWQYIKLIGCTESKLKVIANPICYLANDVVAVKNNTLLFVGRLDYPKRVDRILYVWSHLQNQYTDWDLCVLGDGPDRDRLERLSILLGLTRIQFVGKTDPMPYYQRAKILLMASNYEGTPMVIYEAMAHGVVPIVMNTFPGVMDMISNNVNGITTKRFDINDMIHCCDRVMGDVAQWQQISRNALDKIRSINNEKLLSPWNDLLYQ